MDFTCYIWTMMDLTWWLLVGMTGACFTSDFCTYTVSKLCFDPKESKNNFLFSCLLSFHNRSLRGGGGRLLLFVVICNTHIFRTREHICLWLFSLSFLNFNTLDVFFPFLSDNILYNNISVVLSENLDTDTDPLSSPPAQQVALLVPLLRLVSILNSIYVCMFWLRRRFIYVYFSSCRLCWTDGR
jgi:hypothetical protein